MGFQVAKMSEKAGINAAEMCALEKIEGSVWSGASLAVELIVGDVLVKCECAGHVQKICMRAVLHPALIQAATNTLQK